MGRIHKSKARLRFEDQNQQRFRGRGECNNAGIMRMAKTYNKQNSRFLFGMKMGKNKKVPVSQTELLEKVSKMKYNEEGQLFIKKLLGKYYSLPKSLPTGDASSTRNNKAKLRKRLKWQRMVASWNISKKTSSQQPQPTPPKKPPQEDPIKTSSQQPQSTPKKPPHEDPIGPDIKKIYSEIRPTEMWITQKLKKSNRKKRAKHLEKKSQMPKDQIKPGHNKIDTLSKESLAAQKKNIATNRHAYIKVETSQRLNTLLSCLKSVQQDKRKLVIIVNYASSVKFYAELIQRLGIKSNLLFLSESTPQNEASTMMEMFETSQSATLFCTPSIAAKMKIKGPHCLIQFDPPLKIAKYISLLRKVEKTKAGKSLLFLHPKEAELANELQSADIPIIEYIPQWKRRIDIEKKLDLLIKSFYIIYISALNAYRDFLLSYKLMDCEFLKLSNISVKEVGRSFGFEVPPFVNLEGDSAAEKRRKMDEKKERTKMRRKMKAERLYVHIR